MFRPLSLCNVAYKVITKVLASRFRNVLSSIIHPSHATFIPNRSITNNCIIIHEVIFFMKSKKGKNWFMTTKVDLTKAYDRVEWTVLLQILHLHGFNEKLCNLIKECISSLHFFGIHQWFSNGILLIIS